jgi:hypothetical protein
MTERPVPARQRIQEAQDALLDLNTYLAGAQTKLDPLHVRLLTSKVSVALEAAHHEVSHATCDIEASLNRL